MDYKEYDEVNKIYERHLPEFCHRLKNTLAQDTEKYIHKQQNLLLLLFMNCSLSIEQKTCGLTGFTQLRHTLIIMISFLVLTFKCALRIKQDEDIFIHLNSRLHRFDYTVS